MYRKEKLCRISLCSNKCFVLSPAKPRKSNCHSWPKRANIFMQMKVLILRLSPSWLQDLLNWWCGIHIMTYNDPIWMHIVELWHHRILELWGQLMTVSEQESRLNFVHINLLLAFVSRNYIIARCSSSEINSLLKGKSLVDLLWLKGAKFVLEADNTIRTDYLAVKVSSRLMAIDLSALCNSFPALIPRYKLNHLYLAVSSCLYSL